MQVAAATKWKSDVEPTMTTIATTRATPESLSMNAALPKPAPAPLFAPMITATKDDGLAAATTVAPGGTITYTINITNNGATSPADDATGVMFSDTIDAHTTLVAGSPVAAASDNYNTIGNVQISVPDGPTDLLGNDFDPDTGNNVGMTATAETKSSTNCTGGCSNNVTINANGSFTYNPPIGFSGTDTFTYTANSSGATATTTVKIIVANEIWFINNNAGACPGAPCDGRLSHPFISLAAFNAANDGAAGHPGDNDWIFVFESTTAYTGPATLRLGQKFIGQDATASLVTLTGFTQPSGTDPLPVMNSGNGTIVNITGTNVNGINLLSGNTLRGFTVGSVGTGTKISGTNFGTLTVGNNTTPDVTLGGTGRALNLTTGTFAATSGFVSVASTSSGTQGINLAGVGGTVSFGSTTISGSTSEGILIGTTTANINLGNTSVTGGTSGISFQNNSSGTRTIGTLNVSGGSANAFLHGAAGGNVTVTGAATLSSAGSAVSVSAPGATNVINFQAATSATSSGAGNIGVNWSGVSGASITFNSLSIQRNNATALSATGGGTVNVTNGTGSINNTTAGGSAIVANGVALNANFSSINSTAGTNGVSLTGVSGTSNFGGGSLTGTATGPTFLVSGGTCSVTYSGAITQATNNAMVSISGGHSTGTITFQTGLLSATSGTGLQFDNADGVYNFNGTNTLNGGDAGIDILNGSSGTFSFSSGTQISSPTGIAFNVGTTPGNPSVTYSGSITQNNANRVVNIDSTTGNTITFNTGTITGGAASTGININNANGNVTFSNGMTLGTSVSRMTNQAVTITNGTGTYSLGAVSIFTTGGTAQGIVATNADGTLNSASGTVDTSGAAAINIDGPVGLTTLGMTLTKVSANGGTNGIFVQDANGSFTVTGTGVAACTDVASCTGGAIQNTTADGVRLINMTSPSLTRMLINDSGDSGIFVDAVSGLSLSNLFMDSNGVQSEGGAVQDCNIHIEDLIGTSNTLSNSTIQDARNTNLDWDPNSSASMSTLTVTGTNLNHAGEGVVGQGNAGINLVATGTANVKLVLSGGQIRNNAAAGILVTGGSGTTVQTDIDAVDMISSQPPPVAPMVNPGATWGNGVGTNFGISLSSTGTAIQRHEITNVQLAYTGIAPSDGGSASAISFIPAGTGSFSLTLTNNIIGLVGQVRSGNENFFGIAGDLQDSPTVRLNISSNTVRNTALNGIFIQSRDPSAIAGSIDADLTLRNNTVGPINDDDDFPFGSNPGTAETHAIRVEARNDSSLCMDISANSGDAAGTNNQDYLVRQRDTSTFQLERLTGNAANDPNIENFIIAQNNPPAVQTARSTHATTYTAVADGTCQNPTLPTGPVFSRVGKPEVMYFAQQDQPSQRNSLGSLTASATTSNDAVSAPANFNAVPETARPAAANSVVGQSVWLAQKTIGSDNSGQTPQVKHQTSDVTKRRQMRAVTAQTSEIKSPHGTSRAEVRNQTSKVTAHHARISRPMAAPMSGETVNANIGNLAAGNSVTITFQVTVNNPPNLTQLGPPRVSNQGTVTANGGISVQTDDPTVGGGTDATVTLINLFDTTTSLASDLNPSNFGDTVTFTATINETPVQGSADPAGTVDFIDTSNGNAVICNDVAVAAHQAQCQLSNLTAGTHNVRADYSGDGNFDPSASNVVAQVVNACTPNPIVTSTADAGAGTLREALANVCTGNTITFNIAGPGPHTITLTTGELAVTKDVTINNNSGESITVSGNSASRVFNINSGKTVSINDLTITGGSVPADAGGGIKNSGTLTLSSCNLYGNTAGIAGGISNQGTLTINNCNIGGTLAGQPNSATVNSAGGIQNVQGTLIIKNSSIVGNTASNPSGAGGGISNEFNGVLTIVNSTIANNSAVQSGGGINSIAAVTIINSTISGNQTDLSGGGINTNGVAASLTLINSTISNNRSDFNGDASGGGGGITTFQSTTILRNTVVAGNFRGVGATRDDVDGALDATSSFNLIGDGTGMTGITNGTNGNKVGSSGSPIDAMLGPLANNGGTTQTHGLSSTSPAVDMGSNANLPADTFDLDGDANTAEPLPVDQRGIGFPRVVGSSVDIGAFELGQADLSITKTDGAASEVPGTSVSYTIVVTNSGPSAAIGATVADTFPAALTGVTFTSLAAGGATGNTASGSGNINDTLNMPSGSSVTYTVNATIQSTATGNLANTATVTAPGNVVDPNLVNNSATDTDTLTPTADLSITKTDGAVTEVPGTTVTYTITVSNSGPSSATGAQVSDIFPGTLTGVTFSSVAAGGATGNTASGSGNISDTLIMPSGSSVTYTVTGTVQASATGSLTNTATVTAPMGVTDPNPGNNSATDTDTLTPTADLSITKTDGATTEVPGTSITYTIVVTNNGPSEVTGAPVTDTFPAALTGVTFTSVAAGGATGNTASGSGNISDSLIMPSGSSVTYTINATVAASATGTLSNTATVTAPAGVTDPTPGNNSATDSDTLTPSADVSVTKTDSPDPVQAGNNITYTITVNNVGPSDAQSLSLSDTVPANTTFVSVTTPAGWTRTDAVPVGGTGTITFTRPTLAAGASSVFTLVVNVAAGTANGTTITNTATVSSSTADPTPGNNSATATTLVQNQPNISIQDAQVSEPSSGSVNMIFTVILSAPAPAGGSSVNFTTANGGGNPATAGTCGSGGDYVATNGTVSFAIGEQFKTIPVSVCSDANNSESDETFLVNLSSPVNATIADGTATGTILVANQAGTILISELRTSGPGGAGDDFVEIYNNSNSPHTVNGTGGGYGLFKMGATCSDTPVLIGVIPNGTVIPARGNYLFVGSAYSLANYGGSGAAAGDATLSSDIENDRNVAIFSTTTLASIGSGNRFDAVGFGSNTGGTCDLFREGTTLTPLSGSVLDYSYVRDECGKKGNPAIFGPCPAGPTPKDSNVNNDDFVFVETSGTATPAGQRLGAPGPENLGSPRISLLISVLPLDATKGLTVQPNRDRDLTPQGPNAPNGTLTIRRRFVNNTGAPVTRLRLRIIDISSIPMMGGIADVRAIDSGSVMISAIADSATCTASGAGSPPCTVTVQGTTLEQPPTQSLGGALNSTLTVTLGTPLASGASINLQAVLGVVQTGAFKFFINVEALP